jgi:hypothetical protein
MHDSPPLHEALGPLAFLLGTWRGTGTGSYPDIDDFQYGEEARFLHYGRPVLAYSQRTWSPASGAPMHSEMGFWRPAAGGIEVVLAHAFAIAEVLGYDVQMAFGEHELQPHLRAELERVPD